MRQDAIAVPSFGLSVAEKSAPRQVLRWQFARAFKQWNNGLGWSKPGFVMSEAGLVVETGEKQDLTAFRAEMVAVAREVDGILETILPQPHGLHRRVLEAMRYAVFAGGKRLRPTLVLNSSRLFDVERTQGLRVAAAIEVLHTYSLVHDDLPCMDDDDLRRGRPTTHIAFDEATAVLTGDGLLTLAFGILAAPETHPSAEVRCELVGRLARAAGSEGMVGGQMIDMEAGESRFDPAQIILLQRMKTGALFEFCCESAAVLGRAGMEDEERLRSYARDIGLLFQITDDLLDALGSTENAGKKTGKDAEQGKATLVSQLGVAGAKQQARKLAENAAATLAPYGEKAKFLKSLAEFLLVREA
jgi:farnesyl diphosphate synthase